MKMMLNSNDKKNYDDGSDHLFVDTTNYEDDDFYRQLINPPEDNTKEI